MSSNDFDAILLLSFGGPEKMVDVRPFLENVTRGRGIPSGRLDEVDTHYAHLGGKSPLNDLNREIVSSLKAELTHRGYDLPIYFGSRNWHPMTEDTAAKMAEGGVKRALVFAISAWGGYSGCRQYHEDIARMREPLGDCAFDMERIRSFYDYPLFIEAYANAVREAFARLPDDRRDGARLIFTAHSIPVSADKTFGPVELGGNLYSRQVNETARFVADAVGITGFDVAWQSRSGLEHVPWLEPDIVDHVEAKVAQGLRSAVVCPIGFISDHVGVTWDLDTELQDEMAHHNIVIERVGTPGPTVTSTDMLVGLIEEHIVDVGPHRLGSEPLFGPACNDASCSATCCIPVKRRPH